MPEAADAPLLRPRGEEGAAGTIIKGSSRRQVAAAEWWLESKKLWRIVGPAIFQRIALYGINVVSQAFIGHLGDLELAAFSIASTVVAGFNFGFLELRTRLVWKVRTASMKLDPSLSTSGQWDP